MIGINKRSGRIRLHRFVAAVALFTSIHASAAVNLSDTPLFVTQAIPPLSLLVMGRDHKLYYEAYNDTSDLDGDGDLDVRYNPSQIDYFGYFDSYKCYTYASGQFGPTSTTVNKTCGGASEWSGDFLNYMTMARIDTLRKVLYGGYRSTDTATQTVLERSHIPQDAHSWGKEYTSIAVDGYDIREYTPLDLPANGVRHLFANTTLLGGTGEPLLRVLVDSKYRIWEWVSIERPVAGSDCSDGGGRTGCTTAGGSRWEILPAANLVGLTQTTYDLDDYFALGGNHPTNAAEFQALVDGFANSGYEFGSGPASTVNGSGNPFDAQQENYLTIFKGTLVVPTAGNYSFAVDGDDAVEVRVNGTIVAGWYGGHGSCNCQTYTGSTLLAAGAYPIEFRHEEYFGGDDYYLYWERTVPASTMTDYTVRVEACDATMTEDNCKQYPGGNYKPTGILHDYGESDKMLFGLLTGSYEENLAGGVMRKAVGTFTDEVDANDGTFTSTVGVVKTIDQLKTVGFGGNYEYTCGWITTRAINDGECNMWGNPVGEMMYEGLRYFAGKSGPSTAFSIAGSGNDDAALGLPLVSSWNDPYDATTGYPRCSKPFQVVISGINPSYDTDQVPGSYFASYTGDVTGLDVQASADTISTEEGNIAGSRYIGQSGGSYDGAPTAKTVTSLGNIRGLSPEEPTKKGGYYAASVAYHGLINDISAAAGQQNMQTFAVALASPLPRVEIPVNGTTVTLVPFAKSVGGSSISAAQGDFQPTNQIVDFYIERLTPTGGVFQVNFEDVEQGADHDMDAITKYTYVVNGDNTITITLESSYAAGGIIQHMGYVISGTTEDGTYLEVRDVDTATGSDPDYFLDTPPGYGPGANYNDGTALPLTATRTFTPGTTSGATLLTDPLWYAAKWGGFVDGDNDDIPQGTEWDTDSDGDPDNYFLVTNALGLKDQLSAAFSEVLDRVGSASAVATNSTRLDTNTLIYQARFNTADWGGELLAYSLDAGDGAISSLLWDAADLIPNHASRDIFTYDPTDGTGVPGRLFLWDTNELNPSQMAALNTDASGTPDLSGQEKGANRLAWLRGDTMQEQANGGDFRNRSVRLGDIVNSDPWFVGTADFGYNVLPAPEGTGYYAFRSTTAYRNRAPMLYVGSNDAMLHGFHATTGVEQFAYVPSVLFDRLSKLPDPNYVHEYFVDGQLRHGDAYINLGSGAAWHSLLVGTLGGGGRGLFALDVTDPGTFTESDVLWEFTSGDDGDLGYTLGQAAVVRMANGQWAVIVGNGYNSDNQTAVLFILDAADGSVIKKIDTGAGSATEPNGLATPTPVDVNGDRIVDYIYAGDLLGNMWMFEVDGSNTNNWEIGYGNNSTPEPLFVACTSDPCISTDRQPISSKAQVGLHPDGGTMVYFGTGKFFEVGDNIVGASPPTQTFYGIRDAGSQVDGINDLQEQTILAELTAGATGLAYDVRVTSDTSVDYTAKSGWYLDLVSPVNGREGERVVSVPVLRSGRIIFTTLIPSDDPCEYGGNSWIMELDAVMGSRLNVTPFDLNNDNDFDTDDYVTIIVDGSSVLVPVSGKRSSIGIVKTPGIVDGGDRDLKYTSGSSGSLERTVESSDEFSGRQSWRQLR